MFSGRSPQESESSSTILNRQENGPVHIASLHMIEEGVVGWSKKQYNRLKMNNLMLFPFPLKFNSKSVKLLSFDKFFFKLCTRIANEKRVLR